MTSIATPQTQQKIKTKKRSRSKQSSNQQSEGKLMLPSESERLQELRSLWEDAS